MKVRASSLFSHQTHCRGANASACTMLVTLTVVSTSPLRFHRFSTTTGQRRHNCLPPCTWRAASHQAWRTGHAARAMVAAMAVNGAQEGSYLLTSTATATTNSMPTKRQSGCSAPSRDCTSAPPRTAITSPTSQTAWLRAPISVSRSATNTGEATRGP